MGMETKRLAMDKAITDFENIITDQVMELINGQAEAHIQVISSMETIMAGENIHGITEKYMKENTKMTKKTDLGR